MRRIRTVLLCAASSLYLGWGVPAYAQDAEPAEEPTAEDVLEEAAAEDEDVIIVTGSRIERSGFDTPQPVTVLDSELIDLSGTTNLGQLLNQLPALGSTFGQASSTLFIGTTGLNLLDLRRLGIDRTLVLVNGRRHVGGIDASAAVDVNTIPAELVDRVEVITGGASAIYGADAVSGAVNFVLREDFEGLTVTGQYGDADEGSTETYSIRFTGGGNFANGRGNAVVSAEYTNSSGFLGSERSFRRRAESFTANPDDGDSEANDFNDGIPDNIIISGDVRLPLFSFSGMTATFFPTLLGVNSDGDLVPFDPGEVFDSFRLAIGGDGVPLVDIFGSELPDQERAILNGNLHYDLHENMRLFFEGKYVRNSASSSGTASFDSQLPILADNAFLSDQAKDLLAGAEAGGFFLRRIHNDLGFRGEDITRETFRTVLGAKGDVPWIDTWSYEFSWVYGRAINEIVNKNNRINDRFLAATDAVIATAADADELDGVEEGDIICRVLQQVARDEDPVLPDGRFAPDFAIDGCVPAKVFGENAISAEAAEFINSETNRLEEVEQSVITGFIRGDLFDLPAGPLQFAAGGEYRNESAVTRPPAIDTIGLTFGNVLNITQGGFDVTEGFAEVSVPILADLWFAKELRIDGAFRYASYSSAGNNVSYKASGQWSPTEDVRFRTTFSRAVRAPNVGELFGPQNQTFLFPEDPCDTDNLDSGSQFREDNCRALGIPEGFEQDEIQGNIPGTVGGNPNLEVETADTLTAGIILTPRWIENLQMSLDWWDIEIVDAISSPTLNDTLERCVDGPSLSQTFCSLISRDPVTRQIDGFTLTLQNISALTASGLDFELAYLFDLGYLGAGDLGTLQVRSIGTYLMERTDFPFQEFPDEDDEETGELGDPELVINTNFIWNWRKLTLNYELRYLKSQLLFDDQTLAADPDVGVPVETGDQYFHDIQIRYRARDNVELYAGINNIAQNFPVGLALSAAGLGSSIFDNVGRFYYGGARVKF